MLKGGFIWFSAYIKFLGFNKRKITDYGFNTINHLRFTDTNREVNSKNNYFLFIGRMDSKKNVVFLLNVKPRENKISSYH